MNENKKCMKCGSNESTYTIHIQKRNYNLNLICCEKCHEIMLRAVNDCYTKQDFMQYTQTWDYQK